MQHHQHSHLLEGLDRHSLEYLVSPVLSIDEYESKIDDRRMIVVGIMVRDYQPARDLSQFIEKSSIRPADTEVSPAPTDDGFYLVFVEMARDDEFPKRVIEMVGQISNLTNIDEWKFKSYGDPDVVGLSVDDIRDRVNLDPKKIEIEPDDKEPVAPPPAPPEAKQTAAEAIGRFLAPALCESVLIRDQFISISDQGTIRTYRIRDWRNAEASIPVIGLSIGNPTLQEAMILENCLGPAFQIDTADDAVVITDGERTLILGVDS